MVASGPIGIFDSGIGGLTVFAAIRRHLPQESLLYLGDTARVPYGTKSAETVVRYARECSHFLVDRGVRAVVVACNTASAYALPALARELEVPVIGVVEPGARAALAATRGGSIGVIGTAGTISSNAYGAALRELNPGVRVVSRACPLFVPLIEEGWLGGEITESIVHRYLDGVRAEGIDVLILGCTHYPLLASTIERELGEGITVVDSAETTALALKALLDERGLSGDGASPAGCQIYVTDLPARFEVIAHRFLEGDLPQVTRVDL